MTETNQAVREYIAFDSHKHYTLMERQDAQTGRTVQRRLEHRCGALPTVWIPPADLRDLRELTRTRLVLVAQRTRLKNRLLATLAKHGLGIQGSDNFGAVARHLAEASFWVLSRNQDYREPVPGNPLGDPKPAATRPGA